jgi:hypothetical protein
VLTHRTLRADFHGWWMGWSFLFLVVVAVGTGLHLYDTSDGVRLHNQRFSDELGKIQQDRNARIEYHRALEAAAKRRAPDISFAVPAGAISEWVKLEPKRGYVDSVDGEVRVFWRGVNAGTGYEDIDEATQTDWARTIAQPEKLARVRYLNRDTRPVTVKIWWLEPPAATSAESAQISHPATPDRSTTGASASERVLSWLPKSMRQSPEREAPHPREAPAATSAETWSGTVVAILAGSELEIAGEDGTRKIGCAQAVVYFGEDERDCLDVNAGDVVAVTYPPNGFGAIKIAVVARPARQ